MKRIYRFLLHFYPARFREEFASAMERQFQDEYRDSGGGAGFWLRAFADLAASIPGQILRELRSDATYAVHVYCRRPLVTALALTALALAIGATTGVFSVLNAVLLRSLPFREPERVVQVNKSPVDTGAGRAKFYDWRDHNPLLEQVAGFSVNEMNLALARDSARVKVAETSANFFATLGVEQQFGRGFAKDEDVEGRGAVAVLSHALWQEAFGSNPRALGSTLRLNGAPLTVIGVAPPGFDYPDKTSVWTPTIFDLGRLPKGGAFFWQTIGRIRKGLSFRQANAMLRTEEARLRPASAKKAAPPGFRPVEGESASLKSLRDQLAGPVRDASLVLMGIVLFVLLIACANVAHLLLSRVSERRQELTIRAAMGATRARLAQHSSIPCWIGACWRSRRG
ncbi:MAG: ABC transporter permease [Acidobacteriia bacterium]|nr:ABC transporter permease [Terriglobia bacterium]